MSNLSNASFVNDGFGFVERKTSKRTTRGSFFLLTTFHNHSPVGTRIFCPSRRSFVAPPSPSPLWTWGGLGWGYEFRFSKITSNTFSIFFITSLL